jgi:threonine synthase
VSFSLFEGLSCTKCPAVYEPVGLLNVCLAPGCAGPLFARYRDGAVSRDDVSARSRSIWRWHEMMPARTPEEIVTLGEGGTPLLRASRLGATASMTNVFIKDESGNPTGSFKARGLCAAVTKARALGAKKLAVPTAGNAGGATAAYAARAGLESYVFMPTDTPKVFRIECEAYGAHVTMVDGLIDRCGQIVAERKEAEGWFDVSTLKEPYRVEGKKTMGYELAEDFGWELPDVIVYPTGGGTGLIGMWKAFDEMERLGWISSRRPRMVSVQASGCAPIPKAFAEGKSVSEKWVNAQTYASGLRVPKAYADFLVLKILYESKGEAVAVTDDEMKDGVLAIAASEGIYSAPEGGAAWAAVRRLVEEKKIGRDERVVVFNTGSGFKYVD